MKKTSITLLFIVAFCISVLAQPESLTFENLTAELSTAKSAGDYESIVKKAKNLHSENKKQFADNPERLGTVSLEFALFWNEMLESMFKLIVSPTIREFQERVNFNKLIQEYVDEMERPFEETIEIYEEILRLENLQLANAKFELAKAREKHDSPDKYPLWKTRLASHTKNQELYLGAFKIREKLLKKNDGLVLITAFYLANSYAASSDFENALIYYERFIDGYREEYGKDSADLLPALVMVVQIRDLFGDRENVERISREISAITKQDVTISGGSLLLSPRSTSFDHTGINPYGGVFENRVPTGTTSTGTVENADFSSRNAIQRRQTDDNTSFRVITPGASSFKRAKIVKVLVKVDPEGNVIWLKAETEDSKIRKRVEKKVKKWKFNPFVYKDKPMAMNGFVFYHDI